MKIDEKSILLYNKDKKKLMKIKQKLNLGFIIVIILIIIPVGVSIFALKKVNGFYESTQKLNKLTDLFYSEDLSIDKYSHILMMDDQDDVSRNEKLTSSEKTFLNDYSEANNLIQSLKEECFSDEGSEIVDKLSLNHVYFKEAFERIKEVFVNVKTSEEKISLKLNEISQKRDLIKEEIFDSELQNASSTKNFFYLSLSKYNEIKNLESSFLYSSTNKESLDTLLFSINNFETHIKESSLFDDRTKVFLLFKEYRNQLDIFFADNEYKNFDDYSIDLEIRKLDDHVAILLKGDANNALLRLKEIRTEKIKEMFLFLEIFNLFFLIVIILATFLISKKVSMNIVDPILKLREFSNKIGGGIEHEPLRIETKDEMGDLSRVFNEMDIKLKKSNDELLDKINELKIKDNIESLIESLTDGIIMYDKSKNIVLKNSAVKKILNISDRKLSLKNLYSIFAKHNLEFHIDLSLKTNEIYRIDNVDLLGKKFEVIITQVADYNNKIVGGLMIFHQKENSEIILHKDSSKVDFGPVISPHFGTPLAYIKLFTEMLSSGEIGELNKEQKDCISNIHQSAVNMKEVINKLYDIKILNSDELEIKTEEIEITKFLKSLIEECKKKNQVTGVEFSYKELLSEDIKINIDKKILSKIFEDIIDNALEYSRDKNPIVDIEIKELGFNYLLSIKDNGIGIPDEEQDFIFDKFFRSKNAMTKNSKGSGMSLYIAKRLLNKVGVEIFFESKQGEGTTFFIEIPKGGMRQ
ncbi:MAG: ATP-binding protein [Patescibacteria group bacterium]|jgi:signal transduction histidine kinase|nr:ATP-binding protein [Patescibacteria group bacterium]